MNICKYKNTILKGKACTHVLLLLLLIHSLVFSGLSRHMRGKRFVVYTKCCYWRQPYKIECIVPRPISEVKQCRFWIVPACLSTCKCEVLLVFRFIFTSGSGELCHISRIPVCLKRGPRGTKAKRWEPFLWVITKKVLPSPEPPCLC